MRAVLARIQQRLSFKKSAATIGVVAFTFFLLKGIVWLIIGWAAASAVF